MKDFVNLGVITTSSSVSLFFKLLSFYWRKEKHILLSGLKENRRFIGDTIGDGLFKHDSSSKCTCSGWREEGVRDEGDEGRGNKLRIMRGIARFKTA